MPEDETATSELHGGEKTNQAPAKPGTSWLIRYGILLLIILHLGFFGFLLMNNQGGGNATSQIPAATPIAETHATPANTIAPATTVPPTPVVIAPTPTVPAPTATRIPSTPTVMTPTPAGVQSTRTPVFPTSTVSQAATGTPAPTQTLALAASDFNAELAVENLMQYPWYTVVITVTNSGPSAADSINFVFQGDLFDRYDLLSYGPGLANYHQEKDGAHFDFGPLPAGAKQTYRLNLLSHGNPGGSWTVTVYYNQTYRIKEIRYSGALSFKPEKEYRSWDS